MDQPSIDGLNTFLVSRVARNRGFMVRHFYTEHEAFEWLQA